MASRTVQPDIEQARGTDVDLSPLVGTWFGIKLDENHIAKLLITEQDGKILVHPYGPPDSELPDWGQAEATPYVASGSTMASGLQTQYRFGAMWVKFLIVENQGVLLLQGFTSFHDDGGRTGRFTKAYYRRSAELASTTGLSTGAFSGEWVNSNPATNRVAGFILTEHAGTTTIRIRGVNDPTDWGEAELTAHEDKYGEPYFYAEFDLEPFAATIGVLSIKNLVVLNEWRRYKDGESLNSFSREFFFRNRAAVG
jgi:hypothetical protein